MVLKIRINRHHADQDLYREQCIIHVQCCLLSNVTMSSLFQHYRSGPNEQSKV